VAEGDHRLASGLLGVLEVARGVLSDLDLEVVLERVIQAARELSGAGTRRLGCWTSRELRLSGSSPRVSMRRQGAGSASLRQGAVCSVS